MEDDPRVLYYWGPLVQFKPVISSSSKYLLTALESTIKVFSTASGSLVATLKGHKAEVVGIVCISGAGDQIVSCDESGKLCLWNLAKEVKGSPLRAECCLDIPTPTNVKTTVVTYLSRGRLNEVVVVIHENGKETGSLLLYNGAFGSESPELVKRVDNVKLGHGKVAISQFGDFIAWLTRKELTVMSLSSFFEKSYPVGQREVMCVTCHPSHMSIATGDCSGRIMLWYNIFEKPVKNELHWHTLPVADLAFSSSGAELYSGGSECVLIKWQLTLKEFLFLPRLGMPIKYIMTDKNNSKVICAHVDSSFTVISAMEFKLEGTIQGVSLSVDNEDPYPAGITYDPRTKAVVLNGKSGHIQFYDLHHNKLLYQLDIVRQNYITQERYEKLYNTEIEKIALSPDGNWLATIEYRDDFESSREVRLKFWQFSNKEQSWFLNAGMEMPHDKYVNGLVFDPSSESLDTSVCVSCSDDGKFKVWEVVDNSDIFRSSMTWRCRNIGFYRHLPATTTTVAPDGSLIATGFANILTIWTADQCHLKGTLSQPYLKENLEQIEFGRQESCGSILVSRSENWLCGWNLFTCTLSWRVMINSSCMAVDPLSSYMVVFSNKCDAFIFEPKNSLSFTRLENLIGKPAMCAAFVPRQEKCSLSTPWNEESQLFIIDKAQRLKLIEPKGDIHAAEAAIEGVVQQLVQDTSALTAPTTFASLMAQTKASDVVEKRRGQIGSADFGVTVQNSSSLLHKVLNDARVYRLDAFTALAAEFCELVIPDCSTSEEKEEKAEIKKQMEAQGIETKKLPTKEEKHKRESENQVVEEAAKSGKQLAEVNDEKFEKKKKKKNMKRGFNSKFGGLIQVLGDSYEF